MKMNIPRQGQITLYLLALVLAFVGFAVTDKLKNDYKNSEAGKIELENEGRKLEIKKIEAENEGKRYEARNRGKATSPVQPAVAHVTDEPRSVQHVAAEAPARQITTFATGQLVTLTGPAEVFVDADSIDRITHYGGQFQLWIEGSENRAWTSGYGPNSPMDPGFFIAKFKELHAKGLGKDAVIRITVKAGHTAEFKT